MTTWGFELKNITASWSATETILDHLNFTFSAHDTPMLPLMGPSGQGKSTLLYLLAAIKWPTDGEVIWRLPDGQVYIFCKEGCQGDAERARYLRGNKFGFAFQDSTLSPHLTVLENVAYPLLAQGHSWKEAFTKAKEVIAKVLLPTENQQSLLNRFPSKLSGGQRQRAALAQAIVHDPCVVFADEPTGQLDRATRKQVMSVLKTWVENGNGQRCLIWVTHHHVDDLDLMGINKLLFIDDQQCSLQERDWLLNEG
jgi:putative ABC transport system ATP-binding protein